MDTRLGYMRLPLEVHGAEIAQRRVPARRVVEALDIIEHVRLRVMARSICLPADPVCAPQRARGRLGAALSRSRARRSVAAVTANFKRRNIRSTHFKIWAGTFVNITMLLMRVSSKTRTSYPMKPSFPSAPTSCQVASALVPQASIATSRKEAPGCLD
jgi:hypothetical protein